MDVLQRQGDGANLEHLVCKPEETFCIGRQVTKVQQHLMNRHHSDGWAEREPAHLLCEPGPEDPEDGPGERGAHRRNAGAPVPIAQHAQESGHEDRHDPVGEDQVVAEHAGDEDGHRRGPSPVKSALSQCGERDQGEKGCADMEGVAEEEDSIG